MQALRVETPSSSPAAESAAPAESPSATSAAESAETPPATGLPEAVYVKAVDLANALATADHAEGKPLALPPELTAQIEHALADNAPVKIPFEHWLTHLAGTPQGARLTPKLTLTPDGKSLADTAAWFARQTDALHTRAQAHLAQAPDAQAMERSYQALTQRLSERQNETGTPTPDAQTLADAITLVGQRTGLTPEQAYERYGPANGTRGMDNLARDLMHQEATQQLAAAEDRTALGESARAHAEDIRAQLQAHDQSLRQRGEPGLNPSTIDEAVRTAQDVYVLEHTSTKGKEAAGKAPATEGDINAHLMARVDNDFDALRQEYEQIPETQGGSLLDTDLARELSPEYRADRTRASEVQKSASEFVYRMYVEALKRLTPPGKAPVVIFTAGGSGAGKSSSLALLGELHRKAEIVYDTTLSSFKSANKNIRQALDAGRKVEIVYTYRGPAEAYVNGVLPRAAREGRTVPIDAHIRMHEGALKTIRKLQEKYADDRRVQIVAIDNTHGEGQSALTTLDDLPTPDFAGLKEKLHETLRQEHAAGRLDDAAFTASEGRTAEEHGAPRTEDDTGGNGRFSQGIIQVGSRGFEPQRAQGARQEVGAAGESADSAQRPAAPVWLDASEVRQSQQSISYQKKAGHNLDDIARGFAEHPDHPDLTIDVVRMRDGGLTSVDNSRPAVAKIIKGGKILGRVHEFDEPLRTTDQQRFIARRPNGSRRIPKTWGEAAEFRIWKQGDKFMKQYPHGSPLVPKISGAPEGSNWSEFSQYPWERSEENGTE